MKIKPEHYTKLESALCDTVAKNPGVKDSYRKQGLAPMRYNWDALWATRFDGMSAGQWLHDNLYPYLNDDHINTALARILGNSGKDAKHGGVL